jgi:hypothetical protein
MGLRKNYFYVTIHTLYRNGNGGQATLKGKPFILRCHCLWLQNRAIPFFSYKGPMRGVLSEAKYKRPMEKELFFLSKAGGVMSLPIPASTKVTKDCFHRTDRKE